MCIRDRTHAVEPYRAELHAGISMWPQRLQAAGYRTAYFGKWHVERRHCLERFGFDLYDVEQYHSLQGLVERSDPMLLRGGVRQPGYRDFLLYGVVDAPPEMTPEYRLFSDGIAFLQDAARQPGQPWALFLSTEAPHDPYVVPAAYFHRYDPAAIPRPASFADTLAGRPAIYRRIQAVWETLAWEDYARATACQFRLCPQRDAQVGRILSTHKELGQARDTLVVFTSDHGDYMGAHRLLLKGLPAFEEVYRVPLILSGPGVPPGRRVDRVVSLLDLGRTLVQLTTGDDFPCQGRSLLPLLQEEPVPWQDEAYAEMQGQRFAYQQRVVWRDRWKYVFNTFDDDELYDLAADPHELHNLASDPAHTRVLQETAASMWRTARRTGDANMVQAQYGMFRFAPVGPEV
jgi:choline-sulfatase